MRFTNIAAAWMVCAAIAMPALADDPTPDATEPEAAAPPAGPRLRYQTGDIMLPNKVATLHLGRKYRYLDPGEANKLLMAWGNPSNDRTEGAIVPVDVDPMSENSWAVVLTYKHDGHIDDKDAAKIDYDDILKDLKEGTEDANDDRKKAGFGAVHLVGWAESPRYDAATKKLYWARELALEGSPSHGLNYDVRVLGREGVLSMNAVANIEQLQQIRTDMRPLIDVAEFNEGYRYDEFNSKTDKLAEYGLGALIAGGIAAKAGLFGKLLVWLLAAKKIIFVGLAAIGGAIAKLFGKKKDPAA